MKRRPILKYVTKGAVLELRKITAGSQRILQNAC